MAVPHAGATSATGRGLQPQGRVSEGWADIAVGSDPVGLDPVGLNFVGLDTVGVDPVGLDPVGLNPAGLAADECGDSKDIFLADR